MRILLNIFLFLGVCFSFTNYKIEESVCTLSLNVKTFNSGSLSGGGTYPLSEKVIITATANPSYTLKIGLKMELLSAEKLFTPTQLLRRM